MSMRTTIAKLVATFDSVDFAPGEDGLPVDREAAATKIENEIRDQVGLQFGEGVRLRFHVAG